ncbi:alpha/beta hydrolase [Afifella sp. YEN Y35]|uniref:alpha/beta hydrolase n=1 Tax=Afifella sp. YEN Y35 TaxID=3388337 RepID=UPI0039E1DFD6
MIRWVFAAKLDSTIGLLLGTMMFCLSLTPSLVPREAPAQGLLAGFCFVLGYGLGLAAVSLWRYLELPSRLDAGPMLQKVSAVLCLGASSYFLWCSIGWQNSVRALMGLPPVDITYTVMVVAIALPVAGVMLVLIGIVRLVARSVFRLSSRFIPRRAAIVLTAVLSTFIIWVVANDLLVRSVFRVLDASYSQLDSLLEPERAQPVDSDGTGGARSLVQWDELGRAGREFVASVPQANEISALTGRPAREPIRVYVGLPSAETPEERARLALDELIRRGGFDRSVLVVMTPTGTGWLDPAASDPLEFMTDGDVASVAVQYSYLASPISLLAQAEYGVDTAQALFRAVYGYWTNLPRGERPRLYLHGLSLGALNSQISASLFEMIGDPIQGALWSGPPFRSGLWRQITAARDAGSLARLPVFRGGHLVRFMDQDGSSTPPGTEWGELRVVYLQYPSDPIVFFSPADFYRRPQWLQEPLGSDVSDDLRWFPIVTGFQLGLDMLVAADAPIGHGHLYSPAHYVPAWADLLDIDWWTPEMTEALQARSADR